MDWLEEQLVDYEAKIQYVEILLDKILKFQRCPTLFKQKQCIDLGNIEKKTYGECKECWQNWLVVEIQDYMRK